MKGIFKAFLVVALGVMTASFAFAADAPASAPASKEAKGTITVTKGADGKITAVTIASDLGPVIVTADSYAKFDAWNGKKAEVTCVQKDGKYVAVSGPKAIEEKKADATSGSSKIKTEKAKKL